ncbi:MAG: phosphate acetyltransferase [Actinobacteria bacterium]|nr:phosphate acetyltransferase [Actinomycetota bacterium]
MRHADTFSLRLGDSATRVRSFTAADIEGYRDLSGDPGLGFGDGAGGVPGPLLAGMISDLLGTTLPGLGTMWMKQSLEYGGSAPVGAEVTAEVTITRMVPEKGLVYLDSACRVGGETVVAGSTLVMVPNLGERAT